MFRIELDQDTFSGSYEDQEDDVFLVVGNLTLLPTFPVKFTRIRLEFTGKLYIRQELRRVEKVFYQHYWVFHGQAEESQTFQKGKIYSYPFRLPIPGDLPESVDIHNAKIKYKFRATAEAPVYMPNLKADREVFLRRNMGPAWYLSLNTRLQGIWRDTLYYDIRIPTLSYSTGSEVLIDFKLEKVAESVQINYVGYSLRQRTMYRMPVNVGGREVGTTVKENSRWIKAGVSFFKGKVTQGVVSIEIPKSPRKVHSNCITENIEVNHALHIRLDFKYNGRMGDINVVFPIVIKQASTCVLPTPDTRSEMLPCYDPIDSPPPYVM